MTDEHDVEGYGAVVDEIRKAQRRPVKLATPDDMIKMLIGADFTKAARLPPQSDDSEDDDEDTGEAGQRRGDPEMQAVPKKRKRRAARGLDVPNQARRTRADLDDADEDEDDDECRDDADEGSWPPRKGRADRDEAGRFAARQRRATKVIKALHAAGPRSLTADELLDPQRLAKVEPSRVAQRRDLLAKLDEATDTLRAGGRIDPVALAKAVGAIVGGHQH